MDIPRLYAMKRYWQQHPPLREMVQAYLGIEVKASPKSKTATPSGGGESQNTEADLEDFVRIFQSAGGRRT